MTNRSKRQQELLASMSAVTLSPEPKTVPPAEKESELRPARAQHTLKARNPEAKALDQPVKPKIGKPLQLWMHDEDKKLIRELAAWLAGQGLRTTDSLVIRAALRTVKTGGELLGAYQEAAALDGRLKQHRIK